MSTPSIAEEYAGVRARLGALLDGLPDEQARSTAAPTCPAWSVADVLAHLAGVCDDILAGRLDGVATDPWTHAQVDARRSRTLPELLDEWNRLAPQVEALVPAFPPPADGQFLFDAITHEHDIRTALDRPGARDSGGVRVVFDWAVQGIGAALVAAGVPALQVRLDDGTTTVLGDGKPAAAVAADRFTLLRAIAGRRSLDQIRALDWSADPTPWLESLIIFSPPASAVET